MRTMICLLVLTLFLAGCGSQEPSDSAIQTAIAQTQEAQAPRPIDQDTPAAAETAPTIDAGQPVETPLPPTLEPTQPVESQEVQPQPEVPTLVYSSEAAHDSFMNYTTAGGRLFILYNGYQVRVVDIRSGDELWVLDLTSPSFRADADLVYTWPFELRMDALDANTGELRWSYLSQKPTGVVVASNDKIVVLTEGSQSVLYVIDKSDGTLLSTLEVEAADDIPLEWKRSAQHGNGVVINGKLAFLSSTGQLEWLTQDVPWRICDEVFLHHTAEGLEAIDMNAGTPLWTSEFAAQAGVFGCREEDILIPVDGRTHAISLETGELSWTEPEEVIGSWVGEADGMLVYADTGHGLTVAYDKTNHALLWETRQFALDRIVGVADNTLIGVLWEPRSAPKGPLGIAVGLDTETGTELWRKEIGTNDYDDTFIHLVYGRLLYMSPDLPGIKFVDPRSGDLIVEIPLEKHWSAYFSFTDGMIIVANKKGQLIIRP
jgi:outer membrane protein assembly factor BamB